MVHAGWVYVVGIHPSRTLMSGSFESVRWNACVHRLDLSLFSHPEEFLEKGVRTHVNSERKKKPLPVDRRRIEPATLHHAGQHTTDWAVPASLIFWLSVLILNLQKVMLGVLHYSLMEYFAKWINQLTPPSTKESHAKLYFRITTFSYMTLHTRIKSLVSFPGMEIFTSNCKNVFLLTILTMWIYSNNFNNLPTSHSLSQPVQPLMHEILREVHVFSNIKVHHFM